MYSCIVWSSNYEVAFLVVIFLLWLYSCIVHIEDWKKVERSGGYKQFEDISLNMSEEKFPVTRKETSKLLLSYVDVLVRYTFMNNKRIIMFINLLCSLISNKLNFFFFMKNLWITLVSNIQYYKYNMEFHFFNIFISNLNLS